MGYQRLTRAAFLRSKGCNKLALLELKNLHVSLEDGTEIVKGVDLAVDPNEVHAVMGPNGSGKSTLAYALMGHPAYQITEGQILFEGEDLTAMEADERAQRGLFLAFQYPHAVPGVTVTSFLRSAINSIRKARAGGVDDPIAILDETDSGLDIDALQIVARGVQKLVSPDMGAVVITHYQRILDYIKPDFVHVFIDGRIVEEGGPELAHKLEAEGYERYEMKV